MRGDFQKHDTVFAKKREDLKLYFPGESFQNDSDVLAVGAKFGHLLEKFPRPRKEGD